MHNIRAAIATDEGTTCITRHFGDARYYDLYDVNQSGVHFVGRLENTVDVEENEESHGDIKKASGIGSLLKQQRVNTAVSKVFGPNIKRLIKNYACVIVSEDSITKVLEMLAREQSSLCDALDAGEERSVLDLRKISS